MTDETAAAPAASAEVTTPAPEAPTSAAPKAKAKPKKAKAPAKPKAGAAPPDDGRGYYLLTEPVDFPTGRLHAGTVVRAAAATMLAFPGCCPATPEQVAQAHPRAVDL